MPVRKKKVVKKSKGPTGMQVRQAKLDHVSSRGQSAARISPAKRTAQQKRDVRAFINTFGKNSGVKIKTSPKRPPKRKKK